MTAPDFFPAARVRRDDLAEPGTRRHVPLDCEATDEPVTPPSLRQLTAAVLDTARELGFVRAGVSRPHVGSSAREALTAWLAAGNQGAMAYLESPNRSEPETLLAGTKSLVAVALPYAGTTGAVPLRKNREGSPLIAKYAQGEDYHQVLKRKLLDLADRCAVLAGQPVTARACVDTAPLLEREVARAAGIAFTGKNTMMISPGVGSYTLLGVLLLDLELEPALQLTPEGCGRCTACLDACPTGAFVSPYVLDARRCISYLTIELQGPLPEDLRAAIGQRMFGCDVCQDVCPYNQKASQRPSAPEFSPRPELASVDPVEILFLGSAAHRRLVASTALRRASRVSLARNAAVALGNSNDPRAPEALGRALSEHPSALVRQHAAWGLGEQLLRRCATRAESSTPDARVPSSRTSDSPENGVIGSRAMLEVLERAKRLDVDETVRLEAGRALARVQPER